MPETLVIEIPEGTTIEELEAALIDDDGVRMREDLEAFSTELVRDMASQVKQAISTLEASLSGFTDRLAVSNEALSSKVKDSKTTVDVDLSPVKLYTETMANQSSQAMDRVADAVRNIDIKVPAASRPTKLKIIRKHDDHTNLPLLDAVEIIY